MPAEDLVVTAKWEAAKKADYKIIYWTETVKEGVYTVNHVINGMVQWEVLSRMEVIKYRKDIRQHQ